MCWNFVLFVVRGINVGQGPRGGHYVQAEAYQDLVKALPRLSKSPDLVRFCEV